MSDKIIDTIKDVPFSTYEVVKGMQEAMLTPEYAYEKLLVDIQEDVCEIMKEQGLKKRDLAEKTGLTAYEINVFLQGEPPLTLKTIVKILHALDLELKVRTNDSINKG